MKIDKNQQTQAKTTKIVKQQKQKKKTPNKKATIQELVKKNRNFEFLENGKIRCKITNHEMPATVQHFENHIKSKSYKRALESKFDISQYSDILVDFKGDPRYFYCQLTGAKVVKKKSAIEKHIKGKRFQRVYQEYQNQQQKQEGQEEAEIGEEQQEEQRESEQAKESQDIKA